MPKFKRGIRSLLIAVLLMFAGPVIIHSAFKNQGHALYIPVLVLGIAVAIGAVVMGFRGVHQIVNAFFEKNPPQ